MSEDAADADLLKKLTELHEKLGTLAMPLAQLLEDETNAGHSSVDKVLTRIVRTVQGIYTTAGVSPPESVVNIAQHSQARSNPHATHAGPTPIDNSAPENPNDDIEILEDDAAEGAATAKNTKVADSLTLFSLWYRTRVEGRTVSQSSLFDILCAFDETKTEKRGSFTAKLARWRKDLELMAWDDPEDLAITEAGREELVRRLRIAKEKPGFDLANQVAQDVLGARLEDNAQLRTPID